MITIVSNKQTEYSIIYSAKAAKPNYTQSYQMTDIRKWENQSIYNSVLLLKKYIFDMTGASIMDFVDTRDESAKEIVIGYTNRGGYSDKDIEKLGDEGFTIKTEGERIFILGSDIRGAFYGVMSFLETYCGCRYFTDDCHIVPRHDVLNIGDINDTQIPVFEYRDPYWFSLRSEEASSFLKINGMSERHLSDKVGGGVSYTGGLVHTMGHLSERCAEGEHDWSQPCFSSEEVYQTVLKNVRRKLTEHPEARLISISQNDGNDGGCQCEKCRALFEREGGVIGATLTFVNRIADELKDEFPNVKFDTLAYRFTRRPPKHMKPRDNVVIRLCSIECCFRHPVKECSLSPAHENITDSFADNLRDWAKICDNLYVWDYTTNFTNMSVPFVNYEAIRGNLRFFADNGVKGVFEQGNIASPNGEFGELRAYLLAKLLWNPYMSDEEYCRHFTEFLEGYYGGAGKYMGEFLKMEIDGSVGSHFGIYFDDPTLYVYDRDAATPFDGAVSFSRRGKELFDAAEESVADDDILLARVRRAKVQLINYWYFTTRHYSDSIKDDPAKADEFIKVEDEIVRINKMHFEYLKKYDITVTMEFSNIRSVTDPDFHQPALLWRNPQ